MRVDAHHHLWDLERRDQPWTAAFPALRRSFHLGELKPVLAESTIDATVVVQTVCVDGETAELLELAATEPVVAGVVGWVPLWAPDIAERLDALRSGPGGRHLVGIRHQIQAESDPTWCTRADVRRGLAAVGAAGLAYDLVVRPEQLPATVELVRARPHVRFVLDHGGSPDVAGAQFAPWRAAMGSLAREPNVAVKVSGLATRLDPPRWDLGRLGPYTDELFELFGAARTIYGSDWPLCLLAGTYASAVDAVSDLAGGLSEAERADLFGATAVEWYGLSP